ncbi:hypothetical protein ACFL60_06065 [Candidatus Omnitrophota bacterium]
MTACIFANGTFTISRYIKEKAITCDLIIGTNGGSSNIATLGLKPHLLIGDLDSLPSRGLKFELKDLDMIPGTRGIRNEMIGETAMIWFNYGILLVYIEEGEVT